MLTLIAAVDQNLGIGKAGSIPWKQRNDMQRFKSLTYGSPVIMGRRTFDSLGNKPLPNRFNIIVSRSLQNEIGNGYSILNTASLHEGFTRDAFIIGGGELYTHYLNKADRLMLTRIDCDADCDTFFPIIDTERWKRVSLESFMADENNQYDYAYETWVRA